MAFLGQGISLEILKSHLKAGLHELADTGRDLRSQLNAHLYPKEPLLVVALAVAATLLTQFILKAINAIFLEIFDHGFRGAAIRFFFRSVRCIPGVSQLIHREQQKAVDKVHASQGNKRDLWRKSLPEIGLGPSVIQCMEEIKEGDGAWEGKASGAVYMGGRSFEQHVAILTQAYQMFCHSNPLHPDIFPSVIRFESEVVAMVASLLGGGSESTSHKGGSRMQARAGGEAGAGGNGRVPEGRRGVWGSGTLSVCGNMTSGGTESILMAVKATRDFMAAKKGISGTPEIIVPASAHAAYDKAAQYFKLRLRRVPVDPTDFRADVAAMSRLINRNTILLVASAPGFPHGVIDPIEELSSLALRKSVCLHVDLCLGGFVLPFAAKLGYPILPFDFRLPGVTSISIDTHKYGLAPKGSSIVLYRDHDIRRHQFVAVTEWSGGLYISPSAAGSRPGGLVAAAWASLMAVGEQGYLNATRQLMETSQAIQRGIKSIDGLFILGKPDMTVVAFGSRSFDIYKVNDVMTAKGWSLNALQRPASLHICVTLQHVGKEEAFLSDLAQAVAKVQNEPDDSAVYTMAPVYGAAAKMPDRVSVGEFLVTYLDNSC